jgi:hypothetical protein
MTEHEVNSAVEEILSKDLSVKHKRLEIQSLLQSLGEEERYPVFGSPLVTEWINENEEEIVSIIEGQSE